ncbi:hypothetical protein N7541_010341 [Penicillium brevicompactum]|uniref:Uncharacterized protein n=1 Tax=Penicillium brevicompactum TaxID=5074 RepID=A0A9W9QN83_PENBR|nr:uncharacterized protein N7506_009944 [Penicillium brevicompactum]KAJ5326842.1 hypothetical protein N7506_009944 [Penicillium brevicompactum]KAJ5341217.1 hypothetical protein N7541_010341 [Penicillium brevicompactum]
MYIETVSITGQMSQSSLNKDRDGNEAESADLDTSGFPYREDAPGLLSQLLRQAQRQLAQRVRNRHLGA